MPDEIELKFLDINKEEIEAKLRTLGAKKAWESALTTIFFKKDRESYFEGEILRLRNTENECLLTYKGPRQEGPYKKEEEIEVVVSDFETTKALLKKLGFTHTKEFTKHRIHYSLGKNHAEIDTFPGEQPYLELEVSEEVEMKRLCDALDIDISTGSKKSERELFPEHFK